MLGRFELLFSLLVPWIVAGVVYPLLRRRNVRRLPPGSYVSESAKTRIEEKAPGTRWSRLGVNFNYEVENLTQVVVVALCIFNLWGAVPWFIALDFPVWLNWLGVFALWFQYAWQIATLAYNVNFIPTKQPMKPRHVLATGGPYRLVRHPMYANYIVVTFFVFLATGIWVVFLGALGWVGLVRQAKAEERALEKRFGRIYTSYAARTGRFFPRIRHRRDVPSRRKPQPRTST
jgi:protein-S-isoprenylcysteine O-methyltransferase Ste14